MNTIGARVRLLDWASDEAWRENAVPVGTEGTVVDVEDETTHVRWDTGPELGLIAGHDSWELVSP